MVPLLSKAAKENAGLPMSITKSAIICITSGAASIGDNQSGGKLVGYPVRLSKVERLI